MLVRNSSEPFKITGGGRYISSLKIIRRSLCLSSNLRLSRFFLEHGSSRVDCGIFSFLSTLGYNLFLPGISRIRIRRLLCSLTSTPCHSEAGFGICYCQSLLLIKTPSLFLASTSPFSPAVLPTSLIIAFFTISVGSSLCLPLKCLWSFPLLTLPVLCLDDLTCSQIYKPNPDCSLEFRKHLLNTLLSLLQISQVAQ